MKSKLILWIVVASTFSFAKHAMAEIEEIFPLSPKSVEIGVIEDNNRNVKLLEITATVYFANDCLSPDSKLKALNSTGDELRYSLYGRSDSNKFCNKIYLPMEEKILIDRLEIPIYGVVPKISVNGKIGKIRNI